MRKLSLLACVIILSISACTKIETTNIGSGLIPPVDNVTTFDSTFLVETDTKIDDFIPTVYKNDEHVIGVLNDPIFGTTTASAFFELKPASYPYYFQGVPSSIVADSVDLFLSYTGSYGDSAASAQNQTWAIKEIDQSFLANWKGDTAYKTSIDVPATSTLKTETIGIGSVIKNTDTIRTKFETLSSVIKIRLNSSFAQRLVQSYDSTNAYRNDTTFRQRFAGFAIVPANSQGNTLIRINLLAANTKLALYYHSKATTTATTTDTLVNYFTFNQSGTNTSGSANRIVRNYAGSELATAVTNPAADKVYIQTSPGTYVNVRIPGLKGLPNSIIHRAELIAEQDQTGDNLADVLTAPRYLLLSRYDTAFKGKANVPNDYEIGSTGAPNIETFGGYLFYKTIAGFSKPVASYNFNITRYVQGIVTRKDSSYALRIYAPSNDSLKYTPPYPLTGSTTIYTTPSTANIMASGRVRLGAGNHPNAAIRMRLRIIYSKI